MQATMALVIENDIQPDSIVSIVEKTYKTAATTFCNYDVQGILAAKLSVPFLIALATLDRSVDLQSFSEEKIHDKRISEMMKKIRVEADDELDKLYPEKFPARVIITMADGKVYEKTEFYPKGFPKNPISQVELEEKFMSLVTLKMDETRARKIKEKIYNLEKLDNIRELTKLL
jgi:2-methylcitrate dehydratase PrpD